MFKLLLCSILLASVLDPFIFRSITLTRCILAEGLPTIPVIPHESMSSWTSEHFSCVRNHISAEALPIIPFIPHKNMSSWTSELFSCVCNHISAEALPTIPFIPHENMSSWTSELFSCVRNRISAEALFPTIPFIPHENMSSWTSELLSSVCNHISAEAPFPIIPFTPHENMSSWTSELLSCVRNHISAEAPFPLILFIPHENMFSSQLYVNDHDGYSVDLFHDQNMIFDTPETYCLFHNIAFPRYVYEKLLTIINLLYQGYCPFAYSHYQLFLSTVLMYCDPRQDPRILSYLAFLSAVKTDLT
ncbi:hypothetical protein BYT27DRAFT_7210024 [Phlegmacium glaucopus]|nr:hypothetical protein BYT27DRAFT_7210024 [Phlegmacium glaucopus]